MESTSLLVVGTAPGIFSGASAEVGSRNFSGNLSAMTRTVTSRGDFHESDSIHVINAAISDVPCVGSGTVQSGDIVGTYFAPVDLGLEFSEAAGRAQLEISFDPSCSSAPDVGDTKSLAVPLLETPTSPSSNPTIQSTI